MNKVFQSYYTKSQPLLTYMVSLLKLQPHTRLLEPCAGDGVFIDSVLEAEPTLDIDAYELNPAASKGLLSKYKDNHSVHVYHSDTLFDDNLLLRMNMGGYYDFVIANPPYGAWQDYKRRSDLKKLFPNLYVKESYALFLYQALHLLKPGGRLVFIIPDTFLNLHMHKALRKTILTEACIEELALFPSSFFPGVNFGYSNLSIISLRRSESNSRTASNTFKVLTGFKQPSELLEQSPKVRQSIILQNDLVESIDHSLFLSDNSEYLSLINTAQYRVGDIADCVTGFYSGNDKEFLRVLSSEIRNGSKYSLVSQDLIFRGKHIPSLNGIANKACFVPVLKGGGVRFLKPDLWFLDWGVDAVQHYKTHSKARFQNSQYYFKTGIGVPMISSTSVTAALIENRLFDQSIVGIFPHEDKYLYYLLGFFNSSLCTSLLRTINRTANNSANYVKKLPFVYPNDHELKRVNELIQKILSQLKRSGGCAENDLRLLNKEIDSVYLKKVTVTNKSKRRRLTRRSS